MPGIPAVWNGFMFLLTFVAGKETPTTTTTTSLFLPKWDRPYGSHIAISNVDIHCISIGDSIAIYGCRWVGVAGSKALLSGESKSSITAETLFHGANPISYMFCYTFRLNPGQRFICLHLYPASYSHSQNVIDCFSVKAGPYTLLGDYRASLIADISGVKYTVKEFLFSGEETQLVDITFSPSQGSKPTDKSYASVNSIEIISISTGRYCTSRRESGAQVVGLSKIFIIIDNITALELIQRFHIGGSSIPPVLWESGRSIVVNQIHNLKPEVAIEGIAYLVWRHLRVLDDRVPDREAREFTILVNNQIVEKKAETVRWGGGIGIPVYTDFLVMMEGDREGSKFVLLIDLQSLDGLVFGLPNGIEIFKLSNLENNQASPSFGFQRKVSTIWNPKIESDLSIFGQRIAFGSAITALIIILRAVTYNWKFCEEKCHDEQNAESLSVESSCRCFSLLEMKVATRNFDDAFVIGKGGFGKVYKGLIPGVPEFVAIKRLNSHSKQGAREFWTEIDTLSKLRHINIVSLIGYCIECQEMILVYEYVSSGTIADHLYNFSGEKKDFAPLSWEQRLKICIGAARGLEYLHTGCEYGVIHRDVKDTNILLDESLVAKISDFGLSKVEEKTHCESYMITQVKGTFGYMDPNYFRTKKLSRKSDVFAFGIVMLVVLSGRPAVDSRIPGEPQSLSLWFQECMAEGDVDKIVDPELQGQISLNRLGEFVNIVQNCLHILPERRPTMAQVVAGLEQALQHHESSISSALQLVPVIGHSCEEKTNQMLLSQHQTYVVKESLLFATKGIKSKQARNLAPVAEVKDLQFKGNEYIRLQKPFWFRRLKADFNLGKTFTGNKRKAEESLFKKLPFYRYEILAGATHHFHPERKLRYISYAAVYKGILSSGQEIAVKRHSSSNQQENMEFRNEYVVTSQLQHHNLVRPMGCCVERKEKMLVFEYLPNGTLDAILFDAGRRHLLGWKRRKSIIEGIAGGLLYLHRNPRFKVIHGDLTASNILLDRELNPKISCFHVARVYSYNQDQKTTRGSARAMQVETHLHMASECLKKGLISEKSDVYSYGMLLLEIISGKRCSTGGIDTDYLGLIGWARKLWIDNETVKLVDPAILRPGIKMEILRYVHIALLCVQESAMDLPDVSVLVSMLKNNTGELPQPKPPVYSIRMSMHDKENFAEHGDSVSYFSSTTSTEDSSALCYCSQCNV